MSVFVENARTGAWRGVSQQGGARGARRVSVGNFWGWGLNLFSRAGNSRQVLEIEVGVVQTRTMLP